MYLMTEQILNFLKLGGLFIAIGGFMLVVWYLTALIKSWADRNKGSKISQRIYDAIEKLKMVSSIMSSNMFEQLSKDAQKALADGVVTNEEVKTAVSNVTSEIMNTLKTELPTLTKYFLGEGLESFIKNLVQKYVIDYAKEKFGLKNIPLEK